MIDEMRFNIGDTVRVEQLKAFTKFDESDQFEIVDREILHDGDHMYTLKGIDGEYYEIYESSIVNKIKEIKESYQNDLQSRQQHDIL